MSGVTRRVNVRRFAAAAFGCAAASAAAVVVALPPPAPTGAARVSAAPGPAPIVTSVSPRNGKLAGGTRVRVTGTAFTRGTTVRFNSVPGTAVTVVNSRLLYVTTPRRAAGPVHVLVTTSRGTSARVAADRFTYAVGPQVVVNPGHNGGNGAHTAQINAPVYAGFGRTKACDTTGTATNAGYPEHAFNWDVALRVRKILLARGIRVVLTRPNDAGVGPCVNTRARIQSMRGTAAAVVIHADGAPPSGHGFHVNEDSRPPEGSTALTRLRSARLSKAIHDALARRSGLVPSTYLGSNGYVFRDDFAQLNLSTSPTTFLELGNMRNAADAALQSSPAGRQRIATAVAVGILDYLGW